MVFSADGRILIENLCKFKNYGAKRLIREFPTKVWSVSSVNKLLKKLRDTGTTARRAGSGRRRSVRTDDNVDSINELVLSQEAAPKTHRSIRLILAKKLLHLFPASVVDLIFFTDEIFSVAAPTNLQNDRVYVPATMKKRETPAEQLLIVGLYGYLMFAWVTM